MLRPAKGPPCPNCGCRDVEIYRAPEAGSWRTGQARCRYCDKVFSFRAEELEQATTSKEQGDKKMLQHDPDRAVVRKRLRCPRCNSTRVRTHTTNPQKSRGATVPDGRVIRYHWCLDCKKTGKPKRLYNFKSIEE